MLCHLSYCAVYTGRTARARPAAVIKNVMLPSVLPPAITGLYGALVESILPPFALRRRGRLRQDLRPGRRKGHVVHRRAPPFRNLGIGPSGGRGGIRTHPSGFVLTRTASCHPCVPLMPPTAWRGGNPRRNCPGGSCPAGARTGLGRWELRMLTHLTWTGKGPAGRSRTDGGKNPEPQSCPKWSG